MRYVVKLCLHRGLKPESVGSENRLRKGDRVTTFLLPTARAVCNNPILYPVTPNHIFIQCIFCCKLSPATRATLLERKPRQQCWGSETARPQYVTNPQDACPHTAASVSPLDSCRDKHKTSPRGFPSRAAAKGREGGNATPCRTAESGRRKRPATFVWPGRRVCRR